VTVQDSLSSQREFESGSRVPEVLEHTKTNNGFVGLQEETGGEGKSYIDKDTHTG